MNENTSGPLKPPALPRLSDDEIARGVRGLTGAALERHSIRITLPPHIKTVEEAKRYRNTEEHDRAFADAWRAKYGTAVPPPIRVRR